jgi:methyl-accepting chemotaxis protein
MEEKMQNVKISKVLIIGFSIILILILAIGITTTRGISNIARYVELGDSSNRIVKDILDARRYEKNFVHNLDQESITKVNSIITKTNNLITEIKSTLRVQSDINLLNDLSGNLNQYKTSLDGYVNETEVIKASRNEMNRLGSILIKDAKSQKNKKLLVDILEIRRQEKNFILRHENQYLDSVRNGIAKIIGYENNKTIILHLEQYLLAFNNNVDAYYNGVEKEKNMISSAREVINQATALREIFKSKMINFEESTKFNSLLFLLLVMIICVVVTIVIINLIDKGVKKVVDQTNEITSEIAKGNLRYRLDPDEVRIDFQDIALNINNIIDNFVNPISVMSNYIEKISIGEIPPIITDSYKGDFANVKNNLNNSIAVMNNLLKDSEALINDFQVGNLTSTADLTSYKGSWSKLIELINKTGQSFVGLLDAIPAVIMMVDNEMNIVFMNKAGTNTLAKDRESLKNQRCYSHFKTSDCQNSGCAVAKAMQTGAEVTSETDAHPNGLDLEIMYTGAPMRDLSGKIVGGLEIVIDQTARVKAERVAKKVSLYQNNEVDKLSKILNSMAHGDLTQSFAIATADQDTKDVFNSFKIIETNLNETIESMNKILAKVNVAVDQITEASGEISSGSQSLAGGTSQQASSLEEIASSLEEMNSLTLNNAKHASAGKDLAKDALSAVTKGNDQMSDMNQSMEQIMASSVETGKILKTIDEIAFQTNLLALNAAVEAAHAGEAGKGFAVVAEEVKNLALRSAEAAKNTASLVEESKKSSETGVKIAEDVTNAFDQIKSSFQKVSSIVNEIAVASDEQANGITQVNVGVAELNKVTQQSAANAEESASASEELSSQAAELKKMVNEFKLKENMVVRRELPQPRKPKLVAPPKADVYELTPESVIPFDSDEDDFTDF